MNRVSGAGGCRPALLREEMLRLGAQRTLQVLQMLALGFLLQECVSHARWPRLPGVPSEAHAQGHLSCRSAHHGILQDET